MGDAVVVGMSEHDIREATDELRDALEHMVLRRAVEGVDERLAEPVERNPFERCNGCHAPTHYRMRDGSLISVLFPTCRCGAPELTA